MNTRRSRSGSPYLLVALYPILLTFNQGCWTCRKRHQKCDEGKPGCFNCRLRGVECGGYGVKLGDFTSRGGPHGNMQMVSKIVRGAPNESRPRQGRSRKQPYESQQAASGPKPQNATQPQKNIPAIEPSVKASAVVCASPPSASVCDSLTTLSNADGQETLRKEQSEEQNHLGRSSDDDASIDPSSATSSNQSTEHADTPTGGKDNCVMDR